MPTGIIDVSKMEELMRGCGIVRRIFNRGCCLFVQLLFPSSVPSAALTILATAPLWMQCEHGYSGCIGVLAIGCQVASRSVAGFSSISPFRSGSKGARRYRLGCWRSRASRPFRRSRYDRTVPSWQRSVSGYAASRVLRNLDSAQISLQFLSSNRRERVDYPRINRV